ncbi:MAG TPA: hypothetical protein IAA52_01730 [Candidatus Pullichristensenella stercorigallinarum]|uniref:Uncharacterized protein n=1 Tax=Candidatus Pullichristensenella stercorigallinarum TaxID=2840909 RepID=A0A9D1CVA7_9FIRM|nr:hypothetical protein [Candidatus Pullichristensenella stercorigallinarum]
MKKLLSLFLALTMLACFAGAAMAEDLTVGVNIQEFSNAYPTEMRNGMEETADELGITLDMADGQSSEATISNNIDLFLTKGYTVLAVNMMSTTSAPPAFWKRPRPKMCRWYSSMSSLRPMGLPLRRATIMSAPRQRIPV